MTRIDVHHHVWDLALSPYAWLQAPAWDTIRRNFEFDELRTALRECGIEKTILIQADNTAADSRHARAVAQQEDQIAGFVGWVPLDQPAAVGAALDELAAGSKLVGIRHVLTFETDDDWVLRPQVQRSLGALEKRGLAFDVTSDRLIHLSHVPKIARAFPALHIVVNHIGKPPIGARGWEPWATELARAAAWPNVFAKLSGLTTPFRPGWSGADFRPYVEYALEKFGPERLMYGSNWPVTLVAGSYRQQWDAIAQALPALTPTEHDNIFGVTAARCYRLRD